MPTMSSPPLRPVVVGGDIGAYGSARAFHEAYGVATVVLAGVSTGAVAHSVAVDHRVIADLDDDDVLVAAIRAVAAEQPGVPHLVLGSADHAVHALVRVRDRLTEGTAVVVPYAEAAAMADVTTKAGFSRLCAQLGLPHPRTHVLRVGTDQVPADVTYPAVVKASSSAQFHDIEFEGKRKVAYVADADELDALVATMAAAGFGGEVVVQEKIPGGDEDMAAVNAFCSTDGEVRFLLLGQVLLEEATPNGLGNSVAQITGGDRAHDDAVEHARRLLEHIGWTWFANLDLKRDPRDGRYLFLELNPRVGRSGYAVTAAGYSVARMYGDAVLGEKALDGGAVGPPVVGENEHLFTVVPLALLRRYVSAETWASVRRLRRARAVTNLFYYDAERSPRRWAYIASAMVNQFRKFRRWHA